MYGAGGGTNALSDEEELFCGGDRIKGGALYGNSHDGISAVRGTGGKLECGLVNNVAT